MKISYSRLILVSTLFIALGLNGPVLWRRLFEAYDHASWQWRLLILVAEVALVVSVTALLMLVLGWFGKRAWRFFASVLVIISALCAYYMTMFNVVIGYGVIGAVFATDHGMSHESVGIGAAVWVLFFGVLPAWWLNRRAADSTLWELRRQRIGMKSQFVVLIFCVLLFNFGRAILKHVAPNLRSTSAEPTLNLSGIAAHSYVPTNWISGSAMAAGNALLAKYRSVRIEAPIDKYRYVESTSLDGVQLVIVIGESARHDHLGLLDYARDTSPEMGSARNLAAFRATSCDTSTKTSFRCMFVRPEGVKLGDGMQPDDVLEDTVFSVLRSLGFTIELAAMQSEAGSYQNLKPDRYKIREMILAQPSATGQPLDDRLLVPELRQSITRHPQGRHVTILHLRGSHFLYTQRYPRAFAKWLPECMSVDSFCDREQLINSYDNSIRFTDYVLAQFAHVLSSQKALMIYVSDHGESIGENMHFHATPRLIAPPEQRRVPLMFWASDSLLNDPVLSQHFARLRDRAAQDIDGNTSHGNLFASMLGCLGIESPNGGITPKHDLCN